MSERKNTFRVRTEPAPNTPPHEAVPTYSFAIRNLADAGPPLSPETELQQLEYGLLELEVDDLGVQLKALKPKEITQRERIAKVREEKIARKQVLHLILKETLGDQYELFHPSVLISALELSNEGERSGKDAIVSFPGPKQKFLDAPHVPHYVHKRSVAAKEAKPINVKYLIQKYMLLRKIMPEHTLRAAFVFGEVREGYSKSDGSLKVSERALTLQREVRGKTLGEMSDEERNRPEVQEQLHKALASYIAARKILEDACIALELPVKTFMLELDIGPASPDHDDHQKFDTRTYSSPNVMYDEHFKKVFFIDMGWGEWSEDKQKVFDYIMAQQKPLIEQKPAA